MQWSRYNRLFSSKFGWFVYNALSNTLFELDEAYYNCLVDIKEGKNMAHPADEAFLRLLCEKKILVEPNEEENLLLVRQYQRNAACFDNSRLVLTICPTLRCNFRCPYCFESSQQNGATMSLGVAESMVGFIKDQKDIRRLSVSWFGGEPLLAFDTICMLTEKFKAIGLDYENADLVTNGYLLTSEKIAKLNDLNIGSVQITIDGTREVHDKRRFLAGGGPTFERIIENLTALMDSDYAGSCNIRVNIDKRNTDDFFDLRANLLERFKGKRLSISPGHVGKEYSDPDYDECCLNNAEWALFILGAYYERGLKLIDSFHPGGNLNSICIANMDKCFIVGPEGELYRCGGDVGKPAMAIGNIYDKDSVTNSVLRAQYCIGTDPYSDFECCKCDVLPICGGGCPNKRLRAKRFGEKDLEFCSLYKKTLIDFLEVYIETFRTKEIIAAVLTPGGPKGRDQGYRIISPEPGNTQSHIPHWL